jgi:hypothetical protein
MEYRLFMESIDVKINASKSVVSKEASQFEFAKRLFINQEEITGLKYTILSETAKDITLLPNLIKLCTLRG